MGNLRLQSFEPTSYAPLAQVISYKFINPFHSKSYFLYSTYQEPKQSYFLQWAYTANDEDFERHTRGN